MPMKGDMQWSTTLNTVVDSLQCISPVLGTGMAKCLIEERVREDLISEVLLLSIKRTYMEKKCNPILYLLVQNTNNQANKEK